jgi:cysteinyl-tRNA synthetase
MLRLFNSMGRKREVVTPHDPDHVRMYVCGPTVYSYAHIGNARPAVIFDMLARRLHALCPRVTYARNITDIDDKIIAAAATDVRGRRGARAGCRGPRRRHMMHVRSSQAQQRRGGDPRLRNPDQ